MGDHYAFDPVTPEARQITDLWWLFHHVSWIVYVLVLAFLIFALFRGRRQPEDFDPVDGEAADARARWIVGAALGVTVLVLIVLAVSDFTAGRMLGETARDPVRIKLIGHQWWWEVEYDDPVPSNRVRTANELHVPVGRPVTLELTSTDVIHSFWVPNLQGKKDLIPGYTRTLVFTPQRPGRYVGQCAEFCGYQHAFMRLLVHAEPQEQFEAWKASQRGPARAPATPVEARGQQVFLSSNCIMCHSIQGTSAGASVAPDLTHVASRSTLASGMLPNTPGHLSGWIANPQGIKPGVHMPANLLPAEDLDALTAYLASLR